MDLKNNSKIFMLSFYLFMLILASGLEGQLHLTDTMSRILLGSFLFFSVFFFLLWDATIRLKAFKDFPFIILIIFCIYTGAIGILKHDSLIVLHSIGLLAIFYFVYTAVIGLSLEEIASFFQKLGYMSVLYMLLNLIFLLCCPQRMLDGGVININSDHPFVGFVGSPNSNADVLFIVCIMNAAALILSKHLWERVLFCGSMLTLFSLIILSESRSVIFSIAVLLLIVLIYSFFKYFSYIPKLIKLNIIVGGMPFIAWAVHKWLIAHPGAHIINNSLMGRQVIWKSSIDYVMQHHLYIFGVGLGRQANVILATDFHYFQAHNSFLDIFIGTGFIGLALFLIYFFTIYFNIIRSLWITRSFISCFILLALISITMHSLVESYLINQLSPDLYCSILLYAIARAFILFKKTEEPKLVSG